MLLEHFFGKFRSQYLHFVLNFREFDSSGFLLFVKHCANMIDFISEVDNIIVITFRCISRRVFVIILLEQIFSNVLCFLNFVFKSLHDFPLLLVKIVEELERYLNFTLCGIAILN